MRKEYICEQACFHHGHFYTRGQKTFFDEDYPKDKQGKLAHFRLSSDAQSLIAELEKEKTVIESEDITVREIKQILDSKRIPYNPIAKKADLLTLLNG